ncbi:hypothetical protein LV476_04845 [Guyparkeria hydrothermalis]|uniref:hypothetical protein n=1 Tax=Guyparkeria hydrothermalis TaxID=923 RepID=UPI0020210E05|nr:hypothetical protein [Guyparkeria hydrothermalis]MCL7744279.1 hypothetical protein [Guyparkeria hydrothermalis]
MNEALFFSTTLLLAWAWLGFFYAGCWLLLSLLRQGLDKRDRAYLRGMPWEELPEEERRRVSQRWRTTRWRGLKHYVVGLLLLGVAWVATIAFLAPTS